MPHLRAVYAGRDGKEDGGCSISLHHSSRRDVSIYLCFIYKLRHYYPILSEDDIHIILLLRIDFSNAQISELFHILGSSFRIRRSRLKKKMNVSCESITDFIKSLRLE